MTPIQIVVLPVGLFSTIGFSIYTQPPGRVEILTKFATVPTVRDRIEMNGKLHVVRFRILSNIPAILYVEPLERDARESLPEPS